MLSDEFPLSGHAQVLIFVRIGYISPKYFLVIVLLQTYAVPTKRERGAVMKGFVRAIPQHSTCSALSKLPVGKLLQLGKQILPMN